MTWGWKVPSPVAQQHRHRVAAAVGDGQVEVAVAGEVARHDPVLNIPGRSHPNRVSDRGRERAVAVAQQHGKVIIGGIELARFIASERQVEVTVAGEVARHDGANILESPLREELERAGRLCGRGRQAVRARAAQVLHLEGVRPRGDIEVDQVIAAGGGLAVALHEHMAHGIQEQQPRGHALRLDHHRQILAGGGRERVGIDRAAGAACSRGMAPTRVPGPPEPTPSRRRCRRIATPRTVTSEEIARDCPGRSISGVPVKPG